MVMGGVVAHWVHTTLLLITTISISSGSGGVDCESVFVEHAPGSRALAPGYAHHLPLVHRPELRTDNLRRWID